MLLSNAERGKLYKIIEIDTNGKLLHKLLDMGFVAGVIVEMIRKEPLLDPIEFKIHNYCVSLRKSEADLIKIEIL
ncbi:MAG: ferrous iron transport protein A [Campylobacter sp.]|nr:ferrous iron transport protein A [Campylobacter sp.]